MHIAYAINGEGMGHASRSSVVIEFLIASGYSVSIFTAGGKPLSFLQKKFGSAAEVTSLHMVYKDNRVRRLQTVLKALKNMRFVARDTRTIQRILDPNPPDVVITDFDFHGNLIARYYGVPVISIDNIQYITQAKMSLSVRDAVDFRLNYLIAKMMVPRADYFFITAFDSPELKNSRMRQRVFFIPPLLRQKILRTTPSRGDHILVYQTSDSYTALFSALIGSKERFIAYNVKRHNKLRNVICKQFDEDEFIADLASAKAVIINGGFTALTESLYLHKPVLSIPIAHHFEQRLNGMLMQQAGYGLSVTRLSPLVLREFMSRCGRYEQALQSVTFTNHRFERDLTNILGKIARVRG